MLNCLCYHLLFMKKGGNTSADKPCSVLQHNSTLYRTYVLQHQAQVWFNLVDSCHLKWLICRLFPFFISSCYKQSQSYTLKQLVGGKIWPQTTITSSVYALMAMLAEDVIIFVYTVILKIPNTCVLNCWIVLNLQNSLGLTLLFLPQQRFFFLF